MIIAIDFDGTCTTHAYPHIGEDIGAEPVLKDLVKAGHRLILWTMRSGRELEDAVGWFQERHIHLYGVNSNPTQLRWTKSPKPYAQLYIDDSALGCPLCPPKTPGGSSYVDWKTVGQMLLPQAGELRGRAEAQVADGSWQLRQPSTAQKLWGNIQVFLGSL
jgi:hypothetical protein